MKTYYSKYGLKLSLTKKDIDNCSHIGDCYEDVKQVIKKPYVKKQLKGFDRGTVIKELHDCGLWENEETNQNETLIKLVWFFACKLRNNNYE